MLGTRVDALRVPFLATWLDDGRGEEGFWHRKAFFVMRRPILVATAVVVPLLLLGAPFLRFNPSTPDYRILPPATAAYTANETLNKEFAGEQMTPFDVLVTTDGQALSPENLEALHDFSERLARIEGVRHVSGLFTLVTGVQKEKLLKTLAKPPAEQDPQIQMAVDAFSKGPYFRFSLYTDHAFNDARALAIVDEVRGMPPPPGGSVRVGGASAFLQELKPTLAERAPIMVLAVCAVMFLVLFLVFGSGARGRHGARNRHRRHRRASAPRPGGHAAHGEVELVLARAAAAALEAHGVERPRG